MITTYTLTAEQAQAYDAADTAILRAIYAAARAHRDTTNFKVVEIVHPEGFRIAALSVSDERRNGPHGLNQGIRDIAYLGRMPYGEAEAACTDGWRLPTVKEARAFIGHRALVDVPKLASIWTCDGYLGPATSLHALNHRPRTAEQVRADHELRRTVDMYNGWTDSLRPSTVLAVVLVK